MTVLDDIRDGCARVAAQASWVRIDEASLGRYADAWAAAGGRDDEIGPAGSDPWAVAPPVGAEEATTALVVTLDAINFGSGWHPHVVKRPGCSGAVTIATAWREWVGNEGVDAERLAALTADDAHRIFGQPTSSRELAELMGRFAGALADLGRLVVGEHDGSFRALVESAGGSAARLVEVLAVLPDHRDVSPYRGSPVPLYKRAQLTAADLHRAFAGTGPGTFRDIRALTAFADNLVPHVLRIDGVLVLDADLAARIDRGELLDHHSEPEVELRAVGVHAVERLRSALVERDVDVTSAELDQRLWQRGGGARYKATPRHRSRCTAY